jgi:hypothetical protein
MSTKLVNGVRIQMSAAEVADKQADEVKAAADKVTQDAIKAISDSKLTGVLILGVMCSATKKDTLGMLAVGFNKLLADAAGQALPSTKFEFDNGNELVITADNYSAIQALWVPFRQTFFAV